MRELRGVVFKGRHLRRLPRPLRNRRTRRTNSPNRKTRRTNRRRQRTQRTNTHLHRYRLKGGVPSSTTFHQCGCLTRRSPRACVVVGCSAYWLGGGDIIVGYVGVLCVEGAVGRRSTSKILQSREAPTRDQSPLVPVIHATNLSSPSSSQIKNLLLLPNLTSESTREAFHDEARNTSLTAVR